MLRGNLYVPPSASCSPRSIGRKQCDVTQVYKHHTFFLASRSLEILRNSSSNSVTSHKTTVHVCCLNWRRSFLPCLDDRLHVEYNRWSCLNCFTLTLVLQCVTANGHHSTQMHAIPCFYPGSWYPNLNSVHTIYKNLVGVCMGMFYLRVGGHDKNVKEIHKRNNTTLRVLWWGFDCM
jgi:hypothetical protein